MKPFLLAAAAALLATAPAQAQDPVPAPVPTPETFYFQCGGQTPLTNLTEPPLTWSATKPDTALQDGGGCLSANYEAFGATFGGRYAGEVKQLDLTLFGAYSNPAYRQLLGVSLDVTITVDGTTVFEGTQVAGGNEAAGPLPGGFRWTATVPELDIPATTTPKRFVITVSNPFVDDVNVLGRGASDLPSAITLYDAADIPAPAPEE